MGVALVYDYSYTFDLWLSALECVGSEYVCLGLIDGSSDDYLPWGRREGPASTNDSLKVNQEQ